MTLNSLYSSRKIFIAAALVAIFVDVIIAFIPNKPPQGWLETKGTVTGTWHNSLVDGSNPAYTEVKYITNDKTTDYVREYGGQRHPISFNGDKLGVYYNPQNPNDKQIKSGNLYKVAQLVFAPLLVLIIIYAILIVIIEPKHWILYALKIRP